MKIYEAQIAFRLISPGKNVELNKPSSVAEYLASAFDEFPVCERFFAVFLTRRNRPLGRYLVSSGTLTSTLVSPREVFRGAILANAAALVVAHNHPSGDPAPSQNDICVTRQLRDAARIMEIDLVDHVIVGTKEADPKRIGLYSFRESGIL